MSTPAKGLTAQEAVDIALEEAWTRTREPKIKADHVRAVLAAITESSISIRNAAKVGKLEGTSREVWNLADEVEHVGKQLFSLADELRRGAK